MNADAKQYRTPIKRARGLGSAHSGVSHWWAQRISSIALVGLGLWFLYMVLWVLHDDYATVRATVAEPWNAVLLIALVLVSFWHLVQGLQVVVEDYVHTRWKEHTLMLAIKFVAAVGALFGVLSVLRIALGA